MIIAIKAGFTGKISFLFFIPYNITLYTDYRQLRLDKRVE